MYKYVCIYIIESICRMPETNATFKLTIVQQKKANKSPTLNTFLLIKFIIIVSSFGKVWEMASLCL